MGGVTSDEELAIDGLVSGSCGRYKYNSEFHFSQGKPFTQEELSYICAFCEIDDLKQLSFALGRTESAIATKLTTLRKEGKFDFYKKRYWGDYK